MLPADWTQETPVSVSMAFRQVLGYAPSPPTGHRWRTQGVKVITPRPDGTEEVRRVYLPTIRVGRRRLTTVSAVKSFIDAMNPGHGAPDVTAAATHEQHASNDARLRAAGLLDEDRQSK